MALITPSEAKRHLGITNDTSDDVFLTELCSRVTEHIKDVVGVDFEAPVVTEFLDVRKGSRVLRLRQTPQGALTSVDVTNIAGGTLSAITSDTYTVSGRQIIRNAQPWPEGYQTVKVVYPGFASVPADVKQAALDVLSTLYKGARTVAAGVVGSNTQEQPEGGLQNIPWSVEAVRRKYVGLVPQGF